jgi:hypothetical protein
MITGMNSYGLKLLRLEKKDKESEVLNLRSLYCKEGLKGQGVLVESILEI